MAEEIWHHGIKGMKWGVIRTAEQLGHKVSSRLSREDNSHEDYKRAHDSKNVRSMSDAELRARLNRLNMEEQYSRLNPSSVSRGGAAIKTALAVVGTVSTAAATAIKLRKQYGIIRDWFPPRYITGN